MSKKTEEIKDKKGNIIALVIYKSYHKRGTTFFTPKNFSHQLAFISRKKGEIIKAHSHKKINVKITSTQETIFIKKGKVTIDLYDEKKNYLTSRILTSGDVILLASGGHGFKALDILEMVEVKQGPYISDNYKIIYDTGK